tara:strand:+ start:3573 stop:4073 length:501 start_codon:yes stop_codon:yes gene_type:complete
VLQAKQIIKDSFWILEQNEQKVGTMRKASSTWQVLLEQNKQEFQTYNEVISFLGSDPLSVNKKNLEQPQAGKFDVNGYPTEIKPFNIEVKNNLPTYTKTSKSQVRHCAGYYCVEFPKGWVPSFNPKMQTLIENAMSFAGPFNSEMEMQININNKKRERRQWQTTNT